MVNKIEFQGFYYFAIVEDLLLRFAWILSFVLQEMGYVSGDVMTSVLSPLEVFRQETFLCIGKLITRTSYNLRT